MASSDEILLELAYRAGPLLLDFDGRSMTEIIMVKDQRFFGWAENREKLEDWVVRLRTDPDAKP